MKVLFMGTPNFAVPSLRALFNSKTHEVVCVVTQPDRAVKRGKVECSPVKQEAERLGLTVLQPAKISNVVDVVKAYGADIGVTCAFGQLLTQSVLDAFPRGVINVHASILPKYRGASPINAVIANGEAVTGVTIMQTELGLDTGDILSVSKTEIRDNETAGELTEKLSHIGAKALIDTLDNFDSIVPKKQNGDDATVCKTIKKNELYVDFDKMPRDVVNQIRSLSPLPCARTVINNDVYKIFSAIVSNEKGDSGVCGEILQSDGKLVIACKNGAIEVLRLQAPGKRVLDVEEFLRGKKFTVGTICGKQ